MGYDLHITIGDWWERASARVSRDDWLAMVEADPDLRVCERNSDPESGRIFVLWSGAGAPPEGNWVVWTPDGISAREQGDVFFAKLYEIAERFDASVQGDDGEVYLPLGGGRVSMEPAWRKDLSVYLAAVPPIGYRPGFALLGALGCWVAGFVCGWLFMLLEGVFGGRHWVSTGISLIGIFLFAIWSILLVMGVIGWRKDTRTAHQIAVRSAIMLVGGALCGFIAWQVVDHLGPRSGGLGRVRNDWADWRDHLLGWASVGVFFLSLLPVVCGLGVLIESWRSKRRNRGASGIGHDRGVQQ